MGNSLYGFLARGGTADDDDDDDDDVQTRPWAELPDLILFSILTRLSSKDDRIAMGHACSAWRCIVSGAPPLAAEPPPLLTLTYNTRSKFDYKSLLPNGYLSIACLTTGKIYERHAPGIQDLTYVGTSFNHVILAHNHNPNSDLVLLNLCNGAQTKYPAAPRPFGFAGLSAEPTSPGCRLVLISDSDIQYLRIGGYRRCQAAASWTVKHYPDGIIPPETTMSTGFLIKDRVYAGTFDGRLFEVDIDPPPTPTTISQEITELDVPSPQVARRRSSKWKLPVFGNFGRKLVAVFTERVHYQFDLFTREWQRKDGNSWDQHVGICCVAGHTYLCTALIWTGSVRGFRRMLQA